VRIWRSRSEAAWLAGAQSVPGDRLAVPGLVPGSGTGGDGEQRAVLAVPGRGRAVRRVVAAGRTPPRHRPAVLVILVMPGVLAFGPVAALVRPLLPVVLPRVGDHLLQVDQPYLPGRPGR